jgi:DNA-directed RNA polymerase subunit delta
MVQKRSMTDVAYNFMKDTNKEVTFDKLWTSVCQELALTQDQAKLRIAQFYTQLIIDGRFVTLGENVWDLRERCTFDKVHIDMNDVYVEDDEDLEVEELGDEVEVVDEEVDDLEDREAPGVEEEY